MHQVDILSRFNGNSPVQITELKSFQQASSFHLPEDYVGFLRESNGGEGFIGPAYIILWPLGDLISLNEAYKVNDNAPGLLLFGSDGGGEAFAFDTRSSTMPIVSVPFGGMSLGDAKGMGADFSEFLVNLYNS